MDLKFQKTYRYSFFMVWDKPQTCVKKSTCKCHLNFKKAGKDSGKKPKIPVRESTLTRKCNGVVGLHWNLNKICADFIKSAHPNWSRRKKKHLRSLFFDFLFEKLGEFLVLRFFRVFFFFIEKNPVQNGVFYLNF